MEWGKEQAKAFEALKHYIENLAVMSRPLDKAELLLYNATSGTSVSAALVEERTVEGALTQVPIYFISEALNGSNCCTQKWRRWHMLWSWQRESFTTISKATRSRSQPLSHFGTYFRIEKPPVELASGLPS